MCSGFLVPAPPPSQARRGHYPMGPWHAVYISRFTIYNPWIIYIYRYIYMYIDSINFITILLYSYSATVMWSKSQHDYHSFVHDRFKIQLGQAGRAHPLVPNLKRVARVARVHRIHTNPWIKRYCRLSKRFELRPSDQVDGEPFKSNADADDSCPLFVRSRECSFAIFAQLFSHFAKFDHASSV